MLERGGLKLLRDVFHDEEDTPAKIAAIQEFGGGCLAGIATRYQKAMAFNGTGQNGKSLILEILEGCFSEDARSAVPPQADRYEYPRIRGKLLNCVADIPRGALEETAFLKMAITGDAITCRDVGEPSVTFRPIAGHAYGMNRFPNVHDYSEGFTRRWILIDFPYKFAPTKKVIAPYILENEKPALIRWFLEVAVRLQLQRGYTIPACHERLLARWIGAMDPENAFVAARIERGPNWIPYHVIEDWFDTWCAQTSELRSERRKNVLGRRLTGAKFEKRKIGKNWCYRVQLKP